MVKNLLKNPPANAGDLGDKFNPWVRKIIWRRAWPPTPVSSPGEAQGQRSLAGYSPWGHRDAAARRGWSGSACMCSICTGLKSIKQEGPFSRGFYTKKVPFLTNSHLWTLSCMNAGPAAASVVSWDVRRWGGHTDFWISMAHPPLDTGYAALSFLSQGGPCSPQHPNQTHGLSEYWASRRKTETLRHALICPSLSFPRCFTLSWIWAQNPSGEWK